MGLVILIAMGAMLGWLAAVVRRSESSEIVMRNVGAGIIGAVLAGVLANSASILQGISASALLLALAGAAVSIALANMIRIKA